MASKLDKLCKDLNKKFDTEFAVVGGKESINNKDIIPFTSPRLNYMTYGGLPRGRIIEFFGDENGGKTTTALDAVGNAQKQFQKEYDEAIEYYADNTPISKKLEESGPKKVIYVDCENTLDTDWAGSLGVDVSSLIIIQPEDQYAEEIFDAIVQFIGTGEVGLIVIDSLAAMMSKQEFEKSVEDKTYAGISMALTVFSRKAVQLCKQFDCTIIGINQLREDINNPYNKHKTPGGKAWKFFCSVRMEFRKGLYIDAGGNELKQSAECPYGNRVNVSIVKTKSFPPDRKSGFYTLTYTNGISASIDLVDVAIKAGAIEKAGAWFKFIDIESGEYLEDDGGLINIQGQLNVVKYLEENEDIRDFVWMQVQEQTR